MATGANRVGQGNMGPHTDTCMHPRRVSYYPHLVIALLLGQVEGRLARDVLGRQGAPRLAQ